MTAPRFSGERVVDVVLRNLADLIDGEEYHASSNFREYCAKLHTAIKFLSEVLTCLHFAQPVHPLTQILLARLRSIVLHPYMLQAVRVNPLIANWLLNAVVLLQEHDLVDREREFALLLVKRFGLHVLDAPCYRLEENKYLFAKLKGQRYRPDVDVTYDRNFFRLSRDQVYALTHLLFYVSDYGQLPYKASGARRFALEFLIYDSYLKGDLDVMLELMLVYRSCEGSDKHAVAVFEALCLKVAKKMPAICSALTELGSKQFSMHYHQCLLAVMYIRSGNSEIRTVSRAQLQMFRKVRRVHRFHVLLRSGNYVQAACRFAALTGLDQRRRKFCRDNFRHYLALQRQDFGTGLTQTGDEVALRI